MVIRRQTLVLAALLAGALALGLIGLGWWAQGWQPHHGFDRFADPMWWLGGLVRGVGVLLLGKTGLKLALAALAGGWALVTWRRRRRARAETSPADTSLADTSPAGTSAVDDTPAPQAVAQDTTRH
jgi:4-amino-4-deoxy-L-arabinose transferase-like glycosyltransferase